MGHAQLFNKQMLHFLQLCAIFVNLIYFLVALLDEHLVVRSLLVLNHLFRFYFHLQKCQGGTRMASNWAGYLVKRPGSRNNPTSHLQIPTCGLHTSCGRGVTCTKEREKRRDDVDAAEGHTEDFPLNSMSCVFLFYSTVQHGGIQGGARDRAAFNLCTSRWPQQVL